MFTCRLCETRTARRITKKGYHEGTVLVRCPGCKGLHLIADHLGYFSDEAVDAESLLAARGEAVEHGRSSSSSSGAGAGAGAGDSCVFELSKEDALVLASKGKSVRLEASAGGPAGQELEVVTFDGVMQDNSVRRPGEAQ
jgi:hypothetical protein